MNVNKPYMDRFMKMTIFIKKNSKDCLWQVSLDMSKQLDNLGKPVPEG